MESARDLERRKARGQRVDHARSRSPLGLASERVAEREPGNERERQEEPKPLGQYTVRGNGRCEEGQPERRRGADEREHGGEPVLHVWPLRMQEGERHSSEREDPPRHEEKAGRPYQVDGAAYTIPVLERPSPSRAETGVSKPYPGLISPGHSAKPVDEKP